MHYQSCTNLKDLLKNRLRILGLKFHIVITSVILGKLIFLAKFLSNLLYKTIMTWALIVVQIGYPNGVPQEGKK